MYRAAGAIEMTDAFVAAEVLGNKVEATTELLHAAGRHALAATHPELVNTPAGSVWPLCWKENLAIHVRGLIVDRVTKVAADLMLDRVASSKLKKSLLEETYQTDDPSLRVTTDLIDWTTSLHESGWPVYTHVDHRVPDRINASAYLVTSFSEAHLKRASDVREGKDTWVTPHVLVTGRPEIGRELS